MWKDTIRKKTGDEEYEEGETLQTNNMMRDRRSAESYKTGDTMERPANLEVKMNKAISDIRSMMQPFHEAGFLDYDEHIMAFTDITDKIMNRMMAHATDLD